MKPLPSPPPDSQDSGSLCFCFRWLLIWFKREFSFEDILTMWEVSASASHPLRPSQQRQMLLHHVPITSRRFF